eukprot:440308-Ditylum_brightwellii.AAC.1
MVAPRNQKNLKHVMLGKMQWYSFDLKYQLEILTKESLFVKKGDHDGLLLWHQIVERLNLLTKGIVANLKDKMEGAMRDNFGNNMKKLNL